MTGKSVSHDAFEVIKIPDYRNFVIARFVSVLAIQMINVIVRWEIYLKTQDPLFLGLTGLAEIIPAISVSLYAGHITDSTDRKKIVIGSILLILLCNVAFYFLSLHLQFISSFDKSVIPIYAIIFVSGIARGFLGPSLSAFMAQLVPKRLYANSSAWNSTAWQTASVIGPATAGLLIGFIDISYAYSICIVLMCLSLFFFVRVSSQPVPVVLENEEIGERILEGLKFVFKNQVILGALSLDMFAVLFGGAVALFPIFAEEILKVGPQGLGYLLTAPAVGATGMALFLTMKPPKENSGKILLGCVAGFGLCMILFAISENFYFSLFILALSGMFDNVSVVIRSTIIQTMTPENMRGRVAAVNSIFIGSSNEIGAFESGVAAKAMGTIPSVIFGGIMTLVVVAAMTTRAPKLKNFELN